MKSQALAGSALVALGVATGSLLAPQAASALDFTSFSFGGVEGLISQVLLISPGRLDLLSQPGQANIGQAISQARPTTKNIVPGNNHEIILDDPTLNFELSVPQDLRDVPDQPGQGDPDPAATRPPR